MRVLLVSLAFALAASSVSWKTEAELGIEFDAKGIDQISELKGKPDLVKKMKEFYAKNTIVPDSDSAKLGREGTMTDEYQAHYDYFFRSVEKIQDIQTAADALVKAAKEAGVDFTILGADDLVNIRSRYGENSYEWKWSEEDRLKFTSIKFARDLYKEAAGDKDIDVTALWKKVETWVKKLQDLGVLHKPEKSKVPIIIVASIAAVLIIGAAVYFFILKKH